MILAAIILIIGLECDSYKNKLNQFKVNAIKYGYAKMIVENDNIIFKFNAEIEGEKEVKFMQQTEYIECFCEECERTFKSFIAKDMCPICEKIVTKVPNTKVNYEKIRSRPRWKDEM